MYIYFLFLQSHFLKNRLYLSLPLLYFLLRGSLISMFIKLSSYTALPNCRPFFCLYLTWSCCCILHLLASHSLPLLFSLHIDWYSFSHPSLICWCFLGVSPSAGFPSVISTHARFRFSPNINSWSLSYSSSKHFCCTSGPQASWPVPWEHSQHDQSWSHHFAIQTCSCYFSEIWELSPNPLSPSHPFPHALVTISSWLFAQVPLGVVFFFFFLFTIAQIHLWCSLPL